METPGATVNIECRSGERNSGHPVMLSAVAVSTVIGSETVEPGIRERKRQAVREHLSEVALELLTGRDFDSVTVDEIAAAAGVSRRTFFRYFASKEEVVLGFLGRMQWRMYEAILARPPGEPPITAVHNVLRPRIDDLTAQGNLVLAVARLLQRSPSLRAKELESRQGLRELVAEAIGSRIGVDYQRNLRPRLLAAIALVPLDVAITTWLDTRSTDEVRAILDEAIEAMAEERLG